jgi:hypothetical protein
MSYIGEKPVTETTLDLYPFDPSAGSGQTELRAGSGATSSFNIYEDDGLSLDYEKGSYALTAVRMKTDVSGTGIEIDKPAGKFAAPFHEYVLKVHQPAAPAHITEDGQDIQGVADKSLMARNAGWYYDTAEKVLWVKTVAKKVDNLANPTYKKIIIFKN